VYQGEDNECFGNQQFARPRHQCIDAVYKKTLTYDMARILIVTLAIFDNDASGCYDRIIVALGMIAALRLNLPKSGAKMHAGTLKRMKYYVKTKHGISEAFYKATSRYRLFGTGQGSGASPAVWLTISIVLLSALTALVSVSKKFMDPWHDIFDERNADAYVDNWVNGASDAHLEEAMMLTEILGHLQHNA